MSENQRKIDISIFQKSKKGNFFCGDSYFYHEADNTFICALADGLGSGEHAKESSQIVMDVIQDNRNETVSTMMKKSNKKLVGKRGVVLGILQMDLDTKQYFYSSIGNIGLMTISSDSVKRRNIPQVGFLSGYERPFKVVSDKLEDDMIFVMFSDGLMKEKYQTPIFFIKM
ncbi:phosphoserine phosphatase RsbX [Gracilibacillus boraciitolerans JCM 21714]|uniref:Phosphoserine phosphatase RsbX n=1 Tax=Gracilibacillus boraciitolerans JCM 21714 TaxID=1298598 RepID=W4VL63_9BACI|nr:phosphoserine phosphatase RsbX [Gracilibacillus boraciitolerans JCM 21714]